MEKHSHYLVVNFASRMSRIFVHLSVTLKYKILTGGRCTVKVIFNCAVVCAQKVASRLLAYLRLPFVINYTSSKLVNVILG